MNLQLQNIYTTSFETSFLFANDFLTDDFFPKKNSIQSQKITRRQSHNKHKVTKISYLILQFVSVTILSLSEAHLSDYYQVLQISIEKITYLKLHQKYFFNSVLRAVCSLACFSRLYLSSLK